MSRTRRISRRHFLGGATAAALGGLSATHARGQQVTPILPAPQQSGIQHIVWVMMENRSFDHFLGWLPGADGRQAGLRYPDPSGQLFPTHRLLDFQGCAFKDPDHSYQGGRIEYDGGKCDGWLRVNDTFSIGYYEKDDLAFMGTAAPHWTVCDRYFAAIMAETYPNRFYQHAAQTDRITNTLTLSVLPTIWDRLDAAGLDGKYFFSDIPFLALWGPKYLGIVHPTAEFLIDCAFGTLPQVSFVEPRFRNEALGTSNDDHPHADIRNGEAFLNQIYAAVTTGPAWPHTVLVITFDEWGGFFDHVPPPVAPIPAADRVAGNQDGRLGFRVPALVIAPWSGRGQVSHIQFDHTSVLKLIEWRWGLAPLTVRDASANNLALALDFKHPNLSAPAFAVPTGPFGVACAPTFPGGPVSPRVGLGSLAQGHGFVLP